MPLQNRVSPFGDLLADPARGTFMGNRGGRIHRDDRTLSHRHWSSRQWICCVLDFKERHRAVWGAGYTELFFLDEVTALAAGHRPCFECRRADALSFAECWARAHGLKRRPSAPQMDRVLHAERFEGGAKRRSMAEIETLPDGACIAFPALDAYVPWMVGGDRLLRWTAGGYTESRSRPRAGRVAVLTPPSIVRVLAAGYPPRWHASAARA